WKPAGLSPAIYRSPTSQRPTSRAAEAADRPYERGRDRRVAERVRVDVRADRRRRAHPRERADEGDVERCSEERQRSEVRRVERRLHVRDGNAEGGVDAREQAVELKQQLLRLHRERLTGR